MCVYVCVFDVNICLCVKVDTCVWLGLVEIGWGSFMYMGVCMGVCML